MTPLKPLAPREAAVLREFLADWPTDKEIGYRLGIAAGTVKIYMVHLRTKFQARNRVHLAMLASGREPDSAAASAR